LLSFTDVQTPLLDSATDLTTILEGVGSTLKMTGEPELQQLQMDSLRRKMNEANSKVLLKRS
jgi:hypothetical protein